MTVSFEHSDDNDGGESEMIGSLSEQLLDPQEVRHKSMNPQIEHLLMKSLAFQLRPMNATFSKIAFEELCLLVADQMDSLANELHRLSTLQRRSQIAKTDIEVWLRGFNLNPGQLDHELSISNYITNHFSGDSVELKNSTVIENEDVSNGSNTNNNDNNDNNDNSDSTVLFHSIEQQQKNSQLIHTTNKLNRYVPEWMPSFPPDHTYKFTPQFNNAITDERIIRKRIVQEGQESEKSLLNLMKTINEVEQRRSNRDCQHSENDSKEELNLAAKEIRALFGKPDEIHKLTSDEGKRSHVDINETKFNIEEYAHKSIEIARHKVLEYEFTQFQESYNPLLNLSKKTHSNDTQFQINIEIKKSLKRSFDQLINSIPKLVEDKKKAVEIAEHARDEKLQKLRELRELQDKEKLKKSAHGNGNIILGDTANDNDDLGLFGEFESSDDENNHNELDASENQLKINPTSMEPSIDIVNNKSSKLVSSTIIATESSSNQSEQVIISREMPNLENAISDSNLSVTAMNSEISIIGEIEETQSFSNGNRVTESAKPVEHEAQTIESNYSTTNKSEYPEETFTVTQEAQVGLSETKNTSSSDSDNNEGSVHFLFNHEGSDEPPHDENNNLNI